MTELWTRKWQEATQQARHLSEDLKTNREKKLSFRQKRYQSTDDHTPPPKKGRYEQRQDPNIEETIKAVMLQLQSSSPKNESAPYKGARTTDEKDEEANATNEYTKQETESHKKENNM